MLRSRISPLLQSSLTKTIFRQSFNRIGRHSYSIKAPQLSLVARPLPTKNALQLTRVFSTTAIIKDNKSSAVSTTPDFLVELTIYRIPLLSRSAIVQNEEIKKIIRDQVNCKPILYTRRCTYVSNCCRKKYQKCLVGRQDLLSSQEW